ncbi:MAG: choice-of-anchor B family protein [Candidatus Eisenbacteria bacterium]
MTRSPLRVASSLVISLVLAGSALAQTSENVNLIGTWDGASSYSDIWGYSAPDGTELAIIGLGNGGVSFVNVTNPASPQEVFRAPGGTTIWRDIKTYSHFAYCVDDQAGNGLIVVDMNNPLSPVEVRRRTTEFTTAHNVWIDQEYGLLFACGSGSGGGHMYIYDLTADPSNPQFIYDFTDFYIHDLYSQDGIAYLGAIYDGRLYTADITNLPNSMPVLGSAPTDDTFTHNVWTTEDGRFALTTDEVGGGHITVIDVSDPSNPFKVGQYEHPTNPAAIIHNVTVKGDLAHVAWYTNGYEVVDFSVPASPARAGFYDEFPGNSANYDGAWGIYPYANSGYTYISDISTGLWIVEFVPSYGTVSGFLTDSGNGDPIGGATVEVTSEGIQRTSGGDGKYSINLDPGTYQVDVSAFGYDPISFQVNIVAGQTENGDQQMDRLPGASLSGVVSSTDLLAPLPGTSVELIGTPLQATTDGSGDYSFDFVPAGSYTLRAAVFGYGAKDVPVTVGGSPATKDVVLNASFLVDTMEAQGGWTYSGTGSTGQWENGDPNGTGGGFVQPEDDHTTDPGHNCFFTGQTPPGGAIGDNDIDNGTQVLTSPSFDLTGLGDPHIRYHRWYCNDGNTTVDDVFTIQVSSNGGSAWTTVEILDSSRRFWEPAEFRLEDFVPATANVRIRFVAADEGGGSIVEAGIDDFEIYDLEFDTSDAPDLLAAGGTRFLGASPNPMPLSVQTDVRFQLAAAGEVRLEIVDVQGRRVALLADGPFVAGTHTVSWNGRDERGEAVPAGIYFERFAADGVRAGGRIVVLR